MIFLGPLEWTVIHKGTILQRNYGKLTIPWSFSYNSFVIILVKKFFGATTVVPCYNQICVIMRCVIKGMHCNALLRLNPMPVFHNVLSSSDVFW